MRISHLINLPARAVFDAALPILLSFERQMSGCVAEGFLTAQVSFRYSYPRSGVTETCLIACMIKVSPRTESQCEILIDADGFGAATNLGNQQYFLVDFTKRLEDKLTKQPQRDS